MLIHRIYDWAARRPEHPAVSVAGQRLNYRAFASLIEATRLHLQRNKPQHARFALIAAAGLNGWILTIAARATGLDTIVLSGPAQIAELALGSRAIVLCVGETPPPAYAAAAAKQGAPIISVPSSAYAGVPRLDRRALPRDRDCGAHILLTSGTTGVYKKIRLDCIAEAARADALGQILNANEADVLFMGPIGLWTSAGHNRPVMTWYAGGCVVLSTSSNLAQALTSDGVTQLQLTVPFLATIIDQLPPGFVRNDAIRVGLVGSSPAWPLVERVRERLTRNVNIELGSTEAGTIAVTRLETPEDLLFHRLLPVRQIALVDEHDAPVAQGETGFLKIRLRENDCRSYFEGPEETARFYRGDWFLPGDLARIEADGRLRLLGRVTDVISINGDKHSTLPIEQEVQRRLNIEAAAIIAAPNARGDDEIYVALESADPALASTADWIPGLFPGFAQVHVRVITKLPRNHMGKIDRFALRRTLGVD